ncbi:MAG: NAD-dependent deacylase [Candidatus Zixiibacteriota bacterium]
MDFQKQGLKEAIEIAKNLVIFTGSGVSAESGIPTFRGNEGYWAQFSPQQLASEDGYLDHPDIVWKWYLERRQKALETRPNPAHSSFADMQDFFEKVVIATQNIDKLHQRAGSLDVLELHGSLFRSKCRNCENVWDDENTKFTDDFHICPSCSSPRSVRPDVVWFGEPLPYNILQRAIKEAEDADIFIVAGTSAVVYPAAQLPYIAKQHMAFLIEINTEPTPITSIADLTLRGKAGEILPKLVDVIRNIRR